MTIIIMTHFHDKLNRFMMCRLDSLVGLFAVGCQPTAAADPFGLRRSAYGLVFA
jgi:hypothetical protein